MTENPNFQSLKVPETKRNERISLMREVRSALDKQHRKASKLRRPSHILAAAEELLPRFGFRRVLALLRKQEAQLLKQTGMNRAARRARARKVIHPRLTHIVRNAEIPA